MKRLPCLALAAVALAACGGNGNARLSKSQYEDKLRSSFALPLLVVNSPPSKAVDALGQVAARFGDIASRLSHLRAPTDVQALNKQLVDGASRVSAVLGALVATARDAPAAFRNRLLAEFDPAHIAGLDEFERAAAELEAKGYKFRPTGGT